MKVIREKADGVEEEYLLLQMDDDEGVVVRGKG